MKTTVEGLELIVKSEGYSSTAYKDIGGVWTIGYGHTLSAVPDMKISEKRAYELLRDDVKSAEMAVNTFVIAQGVPLNPHQFDALVSIVFNVGTGNIFTKDYPNGYRFGSTLYNLLLAGDYQGAAVRFLDFCKVDGRPVRGLLTRRMEEKELFLTPIYEPKSPKCYD